MAVELTDQEMERERLAEQIRADMFEDFNEFTTWLAEEFPHTPGAELIHELLVRDSPLGLGIKLREKYWTYCDSKAWEKAE